MSPISSIRSRAQSVPDITYVDEPKRGKRGKRARMHEVTQDEHSNVTGLPNIFTSDKQLPELTSEVLSALEAVNEENPELFVQSGKLVVLSSDEQGHASINALEHDGLRGIIARAANFYDQPGRRTRSMMPPMEVVRDILSLRVWNFPPIKAIVSTPVVRPDGSVLDAPGYDSATQLYYLPAKDLVVDQVPERPTAADVQTALIAIDDIIHDFPYASPSDRANAYAVMLTPYIRMLVGCVPLALFDAPKQGTGKSLHAEIIAILQTGSDVGVTPVPTTEDEWSKALASALLGGSSLVVFDNLVGVLNSPTLAAVLTSRVYRPRLLGKTQTLELHNAATWIATANNVRLGGDFPRRCYPIRLDAKVVHPEQRHAFRHPNLKQHTLAVRGQVIHALLTLIRAWYAAGRPMPEERVVMGSFDEWAAVIAGVLCFAGVPGFLGNVQALHEYADVETPQWEGFFTEWERLFGDKEVLVGEIVKHMETLKDYLPDHLLKAYTEHPQTFGHKLGKTLASQVDVRYTNDGLRLVRGRMQHGMQLWRVVRDTGGLARNLP